MRTKFIVVSVIVLAIQGAWAYFWPWEALSLLVTLPLFIMGIYEMLQKDHTIMRNYPVLGRLRYVMEVKAKNLSIFC